MQQQSSPQPVLAVNLLESLGPQSTAYRSAIARLETLLGRFRDTTAVQVRLGQWQRSTSQSDAVADEAVFLRQTYLATVARLIAYLRVSHGRTPSGADMEGALNGEYFEGRAGLPYLVEDDYFTWPVAGEAREEGLKLAQDLLPYVSQCGAPAYAPQELLALCASVTGDVDHQETAHLVEANERFLDARCGAGAGLCAAIQTKKEAFARDGLDPADALLLITDSVVGTDTHPLAMAVGRVAYLLALGDLLDAPHGDLAIPIFQSDARHAPQVVHGLPGGVTAYAVEVGAPPVQVYVPESLATDPIGLDYLLPFMKGKYAKSVLNAKNEAMLGRAWYSFHNFLVTPTTNRKPFVLTEPEAEVMVQTQKALVELARAGHGAFWHFVLRNAMRGMRSRAQIES